MNDRNFSGMCRCSAENKIVLGPERAFRMTINPEFLGQKSVVFQVNHKNDLVNRKDNQRAE